LNSSASFSDTCCAVARSVTTSPCSAALVSARYIAPELLRRRSVVETSTLRLTS
jgi:hypothetical protein